MTVTFYTLGCKVNQYDTQTLKELFLRQGFLSAPEGSAPDVVVINTCTVTAESDRKGRQAVRRFAGMYPDAVICVTGCLPQARSEKAEGIPEAHIVIGNAVNPQLPALVHRYLEEKRRIVQIAPHPAAGGFEQTLSHSFEGRTRAFVKIEDGCDRFCSYCLIPYARGRARSKPLETVCRELRQLAENGYREVVLAGINLTAYGADAGLCLADAVEAADAIPGFDRVRLGSMEPDQLSEACLDRMARCKKLCPQFHLSLQSGSDAVLARMNRHYDTAFYRDLIARLRARFADCAVTTDVMCGFPGETEEEFAETLAFLEEIGFARVHAFAYSPREGTVAAAMPRQVPSGEKARRMERLTEAARACARRFSAAQVGKRADVLFEQTRGSGVYEGHTPSYLPVRVESETDLTGRILPVVITASEDDFCRGRLVDCSL